VHCSHAPSLIDPAGRRLGANAAEAQVGRGARAMSSHPYTDPQEGSCDRTPFEPEERKKDQRWQLSAHSPRVFGHHNHLAALV
jgi:hypothetical protein